jgi:YidC/Oxa1 family membrane protein insertase
MGLTDILYTLTIWPIKAIIEFLFIFFNRTFYNAGLGIVFLSVIVNTLLLPIYAVADRWQRENRLLQAGMAKKLADIRAVFKGDERQMLINAYYRQMGYSPLWGLKSSVGLLVQIPFFIAAYQFLSHTSALPGESFWVLNDLGSGDALLRVGGAAFNVMPFIMTAVNIISALVYARDLGARDKAQLFGMALVFLVLLYNSPSGLVLYWICNNLFSLGKNIASAKLKHPGRALQILTSAVALVLVGGAVFGAFDVDRYVFLFVALGLCLLLGPFLWKALTNSMDRVSPSARDCRFLYFSSAALLCLMIGALVPAQVLASSVSDFNEPWGFMTRTFIQSAAFFILIPLLAWNFSSVMVKKILALALAITALSSLICLFALSSSYGAMTNSFKIEDTRLIVNAFPLWVNIIVIAVSVSIPCVFVLRGKQKILSSIFNATTLAILVLTAVNMVSINSEIRKLKKLGWGDLADNNYTREPAGEVFPLTRNGNNNFIIFIDKAVGIAMYTALNEMPFLAEQFDGFVWFPNTLSLGAVTITGLPGMLGGYDYIPQKIDARRDVLLKDKINEAITMLPKLFGEAGHRVSITDPTLANMQFVPDISVFENLKNVKAQNIEGRLVSRFRNEFPDKEEKAADSFNFDILFRYGLFRTALPILRYGIYYNGKWWRDGASNAYAIGITQFSSLYYLSDLCAIDDQGDTLNIFMNGTTHESGAYTADLLPHQGIIRYEQEEITKFGSEDNAAYM